MRAPCAAASARSWTPRPPAPAGARRVRVQLRRGGGGGLAARLPALVHIGEALPQRALLPRRVVGDRPVHLPDVDGALQPRRALLARPLEAPGRQAPRVRRELGPNVRVRAAIFLRVLFHKAPEQLLALPVEPPRAVRVPGVKEVDPAVDSEVEDLLQLRVLLLLVTPKQLVSPRPGPQAHLGHLELPELDLAQLARAPETRALPKVREEVEGPHRGACDATRGFRSDPTSSGPRSPAGREERIGSGGKEQQAGEPHREAGLASRKAPLERGPKGSNSGRLIRIPGKGVP